MSNCATREVGDAKSAEEGRNTSRGGCERPRARRLSPLSQVDGDRHAAPQSRGGDWGPSCDGKHDARGGRLVTAGDGDLIDGKSRMLRWRSKWSAQGSLELPAQDGEYFVLTMQSSPCSTGFRDEASAAAQTRVTRVTRARARRPPHARFFRAE